ncbi:MAG: hypothetical protein ACJ701_09695 [Nitrososphaera sp.]
MAHRHNDNSTCNSSKSSETRRSRPRRAAATTSEQCQELTVGLTTLDNCHMFKAERAEVTTIRLEMARITRKEQLEERRLQAWL